MRYTFVEHDTVVYDGVFVRKVTIKQRSVGKSQILSSRRLLAILKYYQADVCWQISNTIKQTTWGRGKMLICWFDDLLIGEGKTLIRNC